MTNNDELKVQPYMVAWVHDGYLTTPSPRGYDTLEEAQAYANLMNSTLKPQYRHHRVLEVKLA